MLVKQHPGWTAEVQTIKLPAPIQTDDGPVSDAVSQITWTGGTISGDHYDDFDITVGQLPKDATDLAFKAIQTYSNHDVVRWIDIPAPGGPQPEHPAAILHLTPAANQDTNAAAGPSVSATTHSSTQSQGTTRVLSIAALIVAVLAVLLATAGLLRKRRTP